MKCGDVSHSGNGGHAQATAPAKRSEYLGRTGPRRDDDVGIELADHALETTGTDAGEQPLRERAREG